MIAMVLGFKNGAELIMTAFGGTAGVFFLMASLSTVIKRDLSTPIINQALNTKRLSTSFRQMKYPSLQMVHSLLVRYICLI